MAALDIAADYYSKETAAGRTVTAKSIAGAAGRSESWGFQTLRKLRASEAPKVKAGEVIRAEHVRAAAKPVAAPVSITAAPATRGTRALAWVGLMLGLGASVAANVAAVQDRSGPRIAAAFAPVALMLAIELVARMLREGRGSVWLKVGAVAIAVVTAVVSYMHQLHLLLSFGESRLSATILPVAVDGLILVSATALLAMKGSDK